MLNSAVHVMQPAGQCGWAGRRETAPSHPTCRSPTTPTPQSTHPRSFLQPSCSVHTTICEKAQVFYADATALMRIYLSGRPYNIVAMHVIL